ncbi:MAG: PA14 domain-containing protein [Planctomycetota bacterium]|jgi:hypothetical protein|nr:PA14 domain-containing protein [Planctomycetota bacterium]
MRWPRALLVLISSTLFASLPAAELAGARWHFSLAADKDQSEPSQVGHAEVWLQDPAASELRVTRDGAVIGHEILANEPGDPVSILFDTSAAGRFEVHLGAKLPPAPAWHSQAGLILETRAWRNGKADTVDQLRQLWGDSGPSFGRGLVGQIYHGFNPYGSDTRFASQYLGWLNIKRPGAYRFATASDDASALWIDNVLVAQWTGWHGATDSGGNRFKHRGAIDLTPGRHRIEYLHAQGTGGSATMAAWLPPGAKKPAVIPATAFVPVTSYQVTSVRGGVATAWHIAGHCADGEHLLVDLECSALGAREGDQIRWQADDGATGEGPRWRHTFIRPGLRSITMQVKRGDTVIADRTSEVLVRRRHHQRHQWPDKLIASQRADLEARDLGSLPPRDLSALIALVLHLEDRAWTASLATKLLESGRSGDAETASWMLELAIAIQHPELRKYDDAARLFDSLTRAADAPAAVRAAAALHLAGLEIQILNNTQRGRKLLADLQRDALDEGLRRLHSIYRADADLYDGKAEEALKRYRSAGTAAHGGDVGYAVRRRVRLETARDYIRRKESDAAEKILREIEWETPEERMGGEIVALQAEVWLQRGEHRFATGRLPVVIAARSEDPRLSELLLLLVRARLAAGDEAGAHQAARQLHHDHPFSEPAARLTRYVDPAILKGTP